MQRIVSEMVDHGGGVDAAMHRFGGARSDWLDLSTGINPHAYPLPVLPTSAWTDLPDAAANVALIEAAREFWDVPAGAAIIAAPGTSALIARLPGLWPKGKVQIPGPTYNEHARAFLHAGWSMVAEPEAANARVLVHPNNPDGRLWSDADRLARAITVIDESFCDCAPDRSLIAATDRPGTVVLKGIGKFWGLAGLRLGFAVGHPETLTGLAEALGPWPVSGPALAIGTAALRDVDWAGAMRLRLTEAAARLDRVMTDTGADVAGGTSLFRLYDVEDAQTWHDRLARRHILTRVFPYSGTWLRLGLPGTEAGWQRLQAALGVA